MYVKLRQLSGRHFNCDFPQDRGPLAALQGGEIAPSVSVSPFPASCQVLLLPPPSGAREGRLFGLFLQGPPRSSHPVGEAICAEGVTLGDRCSPESALSLWPALARKGEIGQRFTPSGPWHLPVPTPQVFGPEPASGKAKMYPVLEECAFGSRLQNQESPTRCCNTSELPLSTGAGAQGRVERSFSLKEESLHRHLLT